MAAGIAIPDYATGGLDAYVYAGRDAAPVACCRCALGRFYGGSALPLTSLLVNGGTAIIGMVMLGMMAYGTWRYGFFNLFDRPLGRVVMALGWADLVGLVCWSS